MCSHINQSKPLFSIIIPVFNTEKYISRCLDSVLVDNADIEIICIDDGSTDNSLQMCKQYEQKDVRVKVITQENMGVSVARNVGICAASGKWLFFVDSDDVVSYGYYDIIKNLEETVDIGVFDSDWGTAYINKPEIKERYFNKEDKEYLLSRIILSKAITDSGCAPLRSPCFKAYRREFILKHNIKFPKDIIIGEDFLFNILAFSCSGKVKYIPEIVYIVTHRYGSATHSYIDNMIEKELDFQKELKRILYETGMYTHLEKLYLSEIKSGIMRCIRKNIFHTEKNNNYFEKKILLNSIIDEPLFQEGICARDYNKKRAIVMFLVKHKMVLALNLIMKFDTN